ncbi:MULTISPECIES: hypothetical protein [Porphyromonas]|nr:MULTISPECIES: hypothetical protein [Porphyromonas]
MNNPIQEPPILLCRKRTATGHLPESCVENLLPQRFLKSSESFPGNL